jgi:hypothetical protein
MPKSKSDHDRPVFSRRHPRPLNATSPYSRDQAP